MNIEELGEPPLRAHGGRRAGSGRKPKPGWNEHCLRLEDITAHMLAEVAHECRMSQSAIVNNVLVKELRKFLKRHRHRHPQE
jgi:hypothetical protein